MEEGDVKGNLVVDIETGIQETENREIAANLGGADMKISTKMTTMKR
jgi:hypothetical protein